MSKVIVFEELRLPLELFAASLVYLLPFGKKRPGFKVRAVLGYVAAALFSLLFFPIFLDKASPRFESLSVFWYTLLALLPILYAKFCFMISLCDALFFSICAFLTQNIIYCSYHCFVARVWIPSLRDHLLLYVLGALVCTGIVLALVYLASHRSLQLCGGVLLTDTVYVFCSLCGMFVAMIVCLFFYQGAFEYRTSVFDALAWLSGILLCLLFLLIQYAFLRMVLSMRETASLENILRENERYYALTKEHIEIINHRCHDLKHQLKALKAASEEDKDTYIQEVEESLSFYKLLVYTDNEALNTILAEKGFLCKEKGIDFRCAVDNVDLSFLRLPDLYAILGNAIDNAIEYVQTQQDPSMHLISLRISQRNQFAGIQVTNPYLGKPLPTGQFLATSKTDARSHGFGLKSIRFLAERYGGQAEWSGLDGQFTLHVLIPLPKAQERYPKRP